MNAMQQILDELSQSEAGRALASLGFRPIHAGGCTLTFERALPSTGGRVRESVVSFMDGQAPVSLLEPVRVYTTCEGVTLLRAERPSLADWLAP